MSNNTEQKQLARLTADIDKDLVTQVKVDAAKSNKTKNDVVEEIISNHYQQQGMPQASAM
jgi:hypothetical protein